MNRGQGLLLLLCALLVATSAWRWHEYAVSSPIQVRESSAAGFLLVVHERDCPDSGRWLAHWIRPLLEEGAPVEVIMLGAEPGRAPEAVRLDDEIVLSRIEPLDRRRVQRILLRAGIQRTPALLLVDSGGVAIWAEALEVGAESSLEAAARRLAAHFQHRLTSEAAGRVL